MRLLRGGAETGDRLRSALENPLALRQEAAAGQDPG